MLQVVSERTGPGNNRVSRVWSIVEQVEWRQEDNAFGATFQEGANKTVEIENFSPVYLLKTRYILL